MLRGNEDLFVGSVSILLGLCLAVAAATNWQWYYSLRSARFIESIVGRTGARLFHASLGIGLIILGAFIASGARL